MLVQYLEDELRYGVLLLGGEAVPKRRHAAPASVDLQKDLGAGELLAGVEVRADPPVGVCGADRVAGGDGGLGVDSAGDSFYAVLDAVWLVSVSAAVVVVFVRLPRALPSAVGAVWGGAV